MTPHLTAAKIIAIAAVGAAVDLTTAVATDNVTIALINGLPAIMGAAASVIAAVGSLAAVYFAYRANLNSAMAVKKSETIETKVDGINLAALQRAREHGEMTTQAATDIGAAQTAQAHAEGHLEGVLTEQERGIREQVRVAQAKVGQTNPPALDAAVGKIADAAGAIADKVAGPEKKSES
jgi:hypothetical protein